MLYTVMIFSLATSNFDLFFFLILFYCAFGVYKMYKINYKIVPETNFNKYLHYGTSGSE